jgi:uncharacterized membrane protein
MRFLPRLAPHRLALPCLAVLALAACSEPGADKAETPAATPSEAELGGVRLSEPISVLGTEPFWNIIITPAGMTYSSPDTEDLSAANPGPVIRGTTATYETRLGERPLELTLIATECSDGMSDRTYPLTAIAELGDTRLNGCAISREALAAMPPA